LLRLPEEFEPPCRWHELEEIFNLRLLMDTRIQSPIYAHFDLFNIFIHLTVLAPELSATLKMLCG
jgi:hypothetical protein